MTNINSKLNPKNAKFSKQNASIGILIFSAIVLVSVYQNCANSNFETVAGEETAASAGVQQQFVNPNEANIRLTVKDCISQNPQWSVDGNTCSGVGFVLPNGAAPKQVANTNAGRVGNAVFSCDNGTLSMLSKSCNVAITSSPTTTTMPPSVTTTTTMRSGVTTTTIPYSPPPGAGACPATSGSFPSRISFTDSSTGATCGITLGGVLGNNDGLPPNNGDRGFSYYAGGTGSDAIPGKGRICLVCRNNMMQISPNPEADCWPYTNDKKQYCRPNTCDVSANFSWGQCAGGNPQKSLAIGESITLQNTGSRATSGSVTLVCGAEDSLTGTPAMINSSCQAKPLYSQITAASVEKKYNGPTSYSGYMGYLQFTSLEVCSPNTSNLANRDCKMIKFDSNMLDKREDYGSNYNQKFVHFQNNNKMVSFWITNMTMVMVLDPFCKLGNGELCSFLQLSGVIPPGPGRSGFVKDLCCITSSGASSYEAKLSLYDAYPKLYINQNTVDYVLNQYGIDISPLLGANIAYNRDFEFNRADVPWYNMPMN